MDEETKVRACLLRKRPENIAPDSKTPSRLPLVNRHKAADIISIQKEPPTIPESLKVPPGTFDIF